MLVVIEQGYEVGFEAKAHMRLINEPRVISLADMPEDKLIREQVDTQIRAIGCTALNSLATEDSYETDPAPHKTLLDALRHAANGDQEAISMVASNVGSDFSERTLKSGEVSKFYLAKTEDGELIQHGQLYSDIYSNTLRLTPISSKMRPRTEAETRNGARIAFWEKRGLLEENYAVVFSPCAEDMTDSELDDAGFFSKTKTLAIQVTTKEDESVSVETAFLAGVAVEDGQRIDIPTIIRLASMFGYDYSDLTSTEIIDRPLLIPKQFMKNGVIDLVQIYDDLAGGTFFGEDKPRQDYKAFRQFCDVRRKSFASDVITVSQQLISEADQIQTPYDAIKRLNELSEAQMVRRAIHDTAIDERVFGSVSASHILHARQQFEAGNYDAVQQAETLAIKTAESRSCPSGVSRQSEADQNLIGSGEKGIEDKPGEDKYGSLTFKCPKGHTNRRPRNTLIPRCKTCGTSVKC